jgi:hypothetical protein
MYTAHPINSMTNSDTPIAPTGIRIPNGRYLK